MKSSTLTIGIAAALAVASAASSRSGSPNQNEEAQATENLLRFIRDHSRDPYARFGVLQVALFGPGRGDRQVHVGFIEEDLRDALGMLGKPTDGDLVSRYTNMVEETLKKEGISGLRKLIPEWEPDEVHDAINPRSQRPEWRAAWVKLFATRPHLLTQLYQINHGFDWEAHEAHLSDPLSPPEPLHVRKHLKEIMRVQLEMEHTALRFFHEARHRR